MRKLHTESSFGDGSTRKLQERSNVLRGHDLREVLEIDLPGEEFLTQDLQPWLNRVPWHLSPGRLRVGIRREPGQQGGPRENDSSAESLVRDPPAVGVFVDGLPVDPEEDRDLIGVHDLVVHALLLSGGEDADNDGDLATQSRTQSPVTGELVGWHPALAIRALASPMPPADRRR